MSANEPTSRAPEPPDARILVTETYVQNRTVPLSALGGLLLLSCIRAFLFRFDHPDVFYEVMAGLLAAFGALAFWFPSKVILSPERIYATTFGRTWLDLPWAAISEMSIFLSPVMHTMGRPPSGGKRMLGFRVKADWKSRVKLSSSALGLYGMDAALPTFWEAPLETVARKAEAYWRANGGGGELKVELPSYQTIDIEKWTNVPS